MDAAGVAHFGQLMHDSQLLNEYLAPPGLSPSSVLTSERPALRACRTVRLFPCFGPRLHGIRRQVR